MEDFTRKFNLRALSVSDFVEMPSEKENKDWWNGKIQKIDNTILEIAKSKTQECNNWFNTHQNKKKTEQSLKNLEGNLNNEQ